MKLRVLAGLLLFLLTPRVHADEKPLVQVQFTYVDTPVIDKAMKKTLPSPKQTTGDALASFLRLVKNAHLHNKVTVGPEITTESGVRAVLDKTDFVSSVSFGGKGADLLVGPRITLTPTVVKDDLVSVVLSLHDMEIVGPGGYWFKKAQVGIAASPPSFQAHSGSTILLAALYSSNTLERFTFATVTILPPGQ